MRFKNILAAISAAALTIAPTVASANPAAKLSVASSVRASAAEGDSKLWKNGWLPVVVLGVVAVAAIVILTNDDDKSDSK